MLFCSLFALENLPVGELNRFCHLFLPQHCPTQHFFADFADHDGWKTEGIQPVASIYDPLNAGCLIQLIQCDNLIQRHRAYAGHAQFGGVALTEFGMR